MSIGKKLDKLGLREAAEHIKSIMEGEAETTTFRHRIIRQAHDCAVVLLTSNETENYAQLHFFYMDEVDVKVGQYLYVSLPVTALTMLHDHMRKMLPKR